MYEMSEKIYLKHFILCVILLQGIISTFLEDDYDNSANLHSRKKRVIDNANTGQVQYNIKDIPYIVKVLKNGEMICAGIIVSPQLILTAKMCVNETQARYSVESGELYSLSPVKYHRPTEKFFEGYLALLLIAPSIKIKSPSQHRLIRLYDGAPLGETLVTISSWGSTSESRRRSIYVPVINLQLCADYYRQHNYNLTDDYLCTFDSSGEKGCTYEDGGSALSVGLGSTRRLVGVLIFAGRSINQQSPDVFIQVINNTYHTWIESNINLHSQNPLNRHDTPNRNRHIQHQTNQEPHTPH